MVTGSLFLCIIVSSHFCPDRTHRTTTDEAMTYFNALRLNQCEYNDSLLVSSAPRPDLRTVS